MEPLRLALVEDEPLFRNLLQMGLADLEGITLVGCFANAAQALDAIPGLRPHVLLSDIDLGEGMTGLQLGLELRKTMPQLGIVLLSNHQTSAYWSAVPPEELRGWSYLLKRTVRDVSTLEQALRGTASGLVITDPAILAQRRSGTHPMPMLSERPQQILELLAEGYSNGAIARRLNLSDKTVENQMSVLYRQLGIDSSDPDQHPRILAALAYLRSQ